MNSSLGAVLLFAFAQLLACSHQTPSAEQRAIALIERLGGKYERAGGKPAGAIESIDLHGSASHLVELETLLLGGTRISDSGLAQVAPLQKLVKLSVFDTDIGDGALEHIAGLKQLETLLAVQSKISPEGLASLQARLPKLRFKE